MAVLKPFVLNHSDLEFILSQVNFVPLFDADGNAIINWDGAGAVYDGHGNVIWDPAGAGPYTYKGVTLTPGNFYATLGTSYVSTTDLSGLRDVSGLNNNLLQVNSAYGAVDQPFTRTVGANFLDYVKPLADTNPGIDDAGIFYGDKAFAPSLSTPASNYMTTVAVDGALNDGNMATTDISLGNGQFGHVTQATVVDYTPRMISKTITTGGATPLLDASKHIVNWDPAQYASDTVYRDLIVGTGIDIATLVEGAAVVTDYATLLANGGHRDFQKTAGTPGSNEIFIGAENPGVAPTNGWFAVFGQFFDHGLDKLGAGGQGTKIKIALATDDPLYGVLGSDGQPTTSITISRATVAGVDANGAPTYINHTSPFIDQSQTYGSDAQMTQLLRQWVSSDNNVTFHAGMELFDGITLADAWKRPDGVMTKQTLPTLSELRDHVADTTSLATSRAALTWEDVLNLRNRDAVTGALSSGESGQALLLDMNPRFDAAHLDNVAAVGATTVNALIDAAVSTLATATPGLTFGRSVSGGIELVVSGGAGGPNLPDGTYTGASALAPWVNFANFSITAAPGLVHDAVGQILMAAVGDHYIAGDGRVNENIALTAIHHVFHEEHNFQVQNVINTIYAEDAREFAASGTHDGLHKWQVTTGTTLRPDGNYIYANGTGTTDDVIAWDQDKMFNAAKLIVEMEYQHAAIDQYARTITPHILEVVGYSSGVDPTVSLEFAQSAFRFGHSTIRETIDTIDPTHGLTGQIVSYALQSAFLNPALYSETGAAAIALGMSHQQMNEVDEFITPALNQGLLGLPLDLAAMNIARGRDFGIPNLNAFREAVGLTTYVSWDDFAHNMIHPTSLANFIAAYAFDGDVAKAQALVGLFDGSIAEGDTAAMGYTADQAIAFMYNEAGAPAGADAFNAIDTWLGGLAEAHVPGGLLGSTFDLVFTNQMESLINGDRFYYLTRLFGQQFSEEVGNGQFKDIVERNTGLEHLNGSILAYADKYYDFGRDADVDTVGIQSNHAEHAYADVLAANPTLGVWSDGSANTNSINTNGTLITVGGVQYIRDFRPDLAPDAVHPVEGTPTSGANSHEVMVGTANADFVHMRSGDDTFYGEGGNDKIFGDFGNDRLYGGAGNDIIDSGDGADLVDGGDGNDLIYGFGSGTEIGGFDQLVGGSGNDTIYGGEGVDKLSGGAGDDALFGDGNTDPFTHGGDGNDYIDGGSSGDNLYGDNGDDFVYGSDDQDIVQGDAGDDILRPGKPSQAINGGPDEVIGGTGFVDTGFDIMDLSDWDVNPVGVTADMTTQQNPAVNIDGTVSFPAWFQMEGVVATRNNDMLIGTDVLDAAGAANLFGGGNWLIGGSGNDTFSGAGGNDLIVGDSIRLDSLIGRYETLGVADTYTTYDAFAGASNRVAATSALSAGLLGGAGLEKHFTEMLKTERFKDLVLGDNSADGTADTVVFTGNRTDYTVERITVTTANQGTITAYQITDTRDPEAVDVNGQLIPTDGTDIISGVENIQFADGTLTPDSLFNIRPDGTLAFTAVQNPGGVSNSGNAIRLSPASSLLDFNNVSASNPTGAVTTGIAYSWLTTSDVAISTNTSANPYVDAAGRLVVHTTNGTIVREKATYTDAANNAEVVTKDWNLIVGTSGNNSGNNANTGTRNGTSNSDAIFGLGGNDSMNGLAGDDRIYGGTGNDTLTGGADNDYLDGGSGTNGLRGGSGNDLYVVSSTDDTVDERMYAGNTATNGSDAGGIDGVLSSITYTLTSSTATGNASRGLIENLTLTGTGNIDGTGNALANVITGNAGNNVLNGGGGADLLIGGLGNDTYVYDAADTITEAVGGGTDLLQSAATVSLASFANIENLTLTGNASVNGTGNGVANVITGNGGANTLTGGGGADVLNGGNGADILIGGDGADTISMGGNDGAVDVARFIAATEYGDTINTFRATGTGIDRVEFGGALNTLFDDGTNDDNFVFVTGNGANGGNTAVNLDGLNEGLFLNGANSEGVSSAGSNDLDNANAVATEFNAEFNITAANGEATLLVINDTNANSAALWQWVQADGDTDNAIDAGELTFIGIINANATVSTSSFDFF